MQHVWHLKKFALEFSCSNISLKDLNIIELIDEKLSSDSRKEITSGEAIAGMIINGLGFISKPLSLTPRVF